MINAKIYQSADGLLSLWDMLNYFEKTGVMRVSDLHLKIGTQPAYRVDGELVRIDGQILDSEIAKLLVYPLLTNENLQMYELHGGKN